ncbi:MAG TPA: serine/threonine-protein kinase [Thermoguttaceae bacterium]
MSDQPELSNKSTAESGLTGRQLGDFRLLRRLGQGAMAEIYLAEQLSLKRRVAVKVLKAELANDPTYLQRFTNEAQAAASLVHAHIVQIYEVGHVDRCHYIAQEYVHGQNLRDWLVRHGPPDLAHTLSIMRQVAAALAKAAEAGVVHRDIKPENILITTTGEVKVADFGLARITREGAAIGLTQVGITMGTPLYMSPEQVEGKKLDHRSDIYSFGVTCYHMLAGSPPFSGDTALSVAVQHLKTQPKPLETLRPDLPPTLCRLIHTMLVKEPERRCQSAREILRELRRLQMEHFGEDWPEELPGWESMAGEPPSEPRTAVTQQLDQLMKTMAIAHKRRRPLRWFVLAAAGTFLLGMVLAWLFATEPFLLADAKSYLTTIPKKANVLQQWYYASKSGTEEAWKSVIKYFPDKPYFTLRAGEQLVLIYIREGRYDEAMDICKELANQSDIEIELRAFGLAGQCAILSIQGKYKESAKVMDEFLQISDNLTSPPMQRLVEETIKRNRANLSALTTEK